MWRRRARVQEPGAHEGHQIVELAVAQDARCRQAPVQAFEYGFDRTEPEPEVAVHPGGSGAVVSS